MSSNSNMVSAAQNSSGISSANGSSSSLAVGTASNPMPIPTSSNSRGRSNNAFSAQIDMSDDEDEEQNCPLCMEELDISDRNFKPCECGYQVCRFCWHHIKFELSGRCPACRRPYSEQTVQWKPVTAEEWKMDNHRKHERKRAEKERKELEAVNRKHLANVRVVQKNLVYISGLALKQINDETIAILRGPQYFGQYGKITKLVVNKKKPNPANPNANNPSTNSSSQTYVSVYITYAKKEDAARAIAAINGSYNDGRMLRASNGTTKYCTAYLRNQPCPNPGCMYLHEPGEYIDNQIRDDLTTTVNNNSSAAINNNTSAGAPNTAITSNNIMNNNNSSSFYNSNTVIPPNKSHLNMDLNAGALTQTPTLNGSTPSPFTNTTSTSTKDQDNTNNTNNLLQDPHSWFYQSQMYTMFPVTFSQNTASNKLKPNSADLKMDTIIKGFVDCLKSPFLDLSSLNISSSSPKAAKKSNIVGGGGDGDVDSRLQLAKLPFLFTWNLEAARERLQSRQDINPAPNPNSTRIQQSMNNPSD